MMLSLSAIAKVIPWEEKFNSYIKGLPRDVTALLKRMDGCNHFGGEEPYDEARAEEISKAVNTLKCTDVENDKKNLMKKYKARPKIIKKINNFPTALD